MSPVPFTRLIAPKLSTAYVEVSESTYERGLDQPLHTHEPAYITAVIAGSYRERAGRTTREVDEGAMLYHPAGEQHAVQFHAPLTRAFRVQPLVAMLEAERLARVSFESMLSRTENARLIVMRLRRVYVAGDVLAPLMLDGLACELVACCAATRARRAHTDNRAAARARDLIEANLAHTPSLRDLAAAAQCHPITLARAFRRAFGSSIGSYIRRRRLEHAAQLLQHSRLSISSIALLSGFSDQAHLTRALRHHTGHTPGRLRAFNTANCTIL